jgi:hypothetical protein
MKFRDYFSLKHILFAVVLMAIMLFFAIRQSNNTVKVYFEDTNVQVTSSKYSMTIQYADILSAELVPVEAAGEKIADTYDDDILRAGTWRNAVWGEYSICADLDTTNCIVLTIDGGRTLVFSRKNDETTAEIFQTLQTYLGK